MAKSFEEVPEPSGEGKVEHTAPIDYGDLLGERKKEKKFRSQPFELRAVINDREFLNFLAEFEDTAELDLTEENIKEIEHRYRAYESREFLKIELPDLYKKELEPNFGIEFAKKDFEALEGFLAEEARKNPEMMIGLSEQLANYQGLKRENAELEIKIIELGGEQNLENVAQELEKQKKYLEEKKDVGKWSAGWRKWANPKNYALIEDLFKPKGRITRKAVREMGRQERSHFFQELDDQLVDLGRKKEFIKDYPTLKEARKELDGILKKQFFENFEPAKEVFKIMTQRCVTKMEKLIGKPDQKQALAIYEEAQEYLERLESRKESFDFEELKNLPISNFQARIDEMLERVVVDNIQASVKEFELGNQPLDELQKELDKYLGKEKLGSKDRVELQRFIAEFIKFEIEEFMDKKPKNYKQKTVLLRMVLQKIVSGQ